MEQYIFIVVFLLFIPIVFKLLRSLKFEHLFQQGKVFEIRCAYILATILISEILTQALERLFSLFFV